MRLDSDLRDLVYKIYSLARKTWLSTLKTSMDNDLCLNCANLLAVSESLPLHSLYFTLLVMDSTISCQCRLMAIQSRACLASHMVWLQEPFLWPSRLEWAPYSHSSNSTETWVKLYCLLRRTRTMYEAAKIEWSLKSLRISSMVSDMVQIVSSLE